jgi:hypothetical protein
MSTQSMPIPDPELRNFAPPELSRKYFEWGPRFPFEPNASGWSPANAAWLAEASFAAYGDFPNQHSNIDLGHLKTANWSFDAVSQQNVQCLCLEGPNALILAFRGTRLEGFGDSSSWFHGYASNWKDLVTDLEFPPAQLGDGREVHAGFKSALDTVFPQVQARVSKAKGKKTWCTGHSLGAAIATLAVDRLARGEASNKFEVQGLYTYGSPRVGNAAFVNSIPLSNIYRYVHHRDIVTTVPPPGFYAHVGNLRYITAAGQVHETADKQTLLSHIHESFSFAKEIFDITTRDFKLTDMGTWPVVSQALADHAPVYYANKIWNQLLGH